MQSHVIPWPDGAQFTRLRRGENGIPHRAIVQVSRTADGGVSATFHVWRDAADFAPLDCVVEESADGASWAAVGAARPANQF